MYPRSTEAILPTIAMILMGIEAIDGYLSREGVISRKRITIISLAEELDDCSCHDNDMKTHCGKLVNGLSSSCMTKLNKQCRMSGY